ncbi:hypothetical protein ACIOEW_36155 [Streptomyces sp. NPDC087901]|uniref:hypothetical protein n=1 Tax=Streptomyces sp. NPDC087901 TaxID=3365818 RepID=UPI003821C0D5
MGTAVDLGELILGSGQADLESFDLTEPALPLGFGDPVEEVVADLHEPAALRWLWPEEGAADVPLTELTEVPPWASFEANSQ